MSDGKSPLAWASRQSPFRQRYVTTVLTVWAAILLACTSSPARELTSPSGPVPTATARPQPSLQSLYTVVPLASVRLENSTRNDGGARNEITRIPPPSLDQAQTEDSRWLGELGYRGVLPQVFDKSVRSSTTCIDANIDGPMRSRDWVLDRSQEASTGDWLLVPADQTSFRSPTPPILLRAKLLDGSDATHVTEIDRSRSEIRQSDLAVRVPVELPRVGPWAVVVTSNGLWGCFLVTIGEVKAPRGTTIPSIEMRAGMVPPTSEPTIRPSSFDRPFLQGGSDRRCTAGGNSHARSGEWVFDPMGYAADWDPMKAQAKTAWVPLHKPASDGKPIPLILRATLLDAPTHTYTYVSPAWVSGDSAVFYATSSFGLPRAGNWAIEASAGPNWGCFLVGVD